MSTECIATGPRLTYTLLDVFLDISLYLCSAHHKISSTKIAKTPEEHFIKIFITILGITLIQKSINNVTQKHDFGANFNCFK